jgi:hypothetical protein
MADINQDRTIPGLLIARKNILGLLRRLEQGKDYEPENIERIGDYIANYGDRVIPIIIKEMEKMSDEIPLRKMEYLIEYLDDDKFEPELINLLSKTKDNLRLRKSVINILKFYGADFYQPPLCTFMEKINEEVRTLSQELTENINTPGDYLFRLLDEFHYLETEDQRNMLRQLTDFSNPAELKIIEMALRTGINDIILEAMSILGRIKSREALRILNDALIYLPNKYHENLIRNSRKLNFMGIVESSDNRQVDNVKCAYIGYPMAYGERHMLFIIENGGTEHILFFEIEEKWGINEGCHACMDIKKVNMPQVLNNYVEQFYLKEVNLTYAAKIFADAVRKNYTFDVPFPSAFPLVSMYLPSYYIKPYVYNAYKVKLSFAGNDQLVSLIRRSAELWEEFDFLGWFTEDARFEDIIDRWYKNSKNDEPSWMDDLLIRKVSREIIIPELDLWKERLYALADFLVNISEYQEYIPMILAVENVMVKDIEAMENIPFFRKMIIESKNIIFYQTSEEEA